MSDDTFLPPHAPPHTQPEVYWRSRRRMAAASMIGIFATGVILSFQVEEVTTAHAWLIALGTIVVFSCIFVFFRLFKTGHIHFFHCFLQR